MIRLRHILSIPMFLTALALLWVLWRQAGSLGLLLGLGSALIVALGLWTVGVRQTRGAGFAWLFALPALALAIAPAAFVRPVALEKSSIPLPAYRSRLDQSRGDSCEDCQQSDRHQA